MQVQETFQFTTSYLYQEGGRRYKTIDTRPDFGTVFHLHGLPRKAITLREAAQHYFDLPIESARDFVKGIRTRKIKGKTYFDEVDIIQRTQEQEYLLSVLHDRWGEHYVES